MDEANGKQRTATYYFYYSECTDNTIYHESPLAAAAAVASAAYAGHACQLDTTHI